MEFDEQKAREIVSQFGMSDKTIRVWKIRGRTPDKYADTGYQPRSTSKAGDIRHQRFVELLESGIISITVLSELIQLPEIKLTDAKRGKTRLSDADLDKCLIEIKRLKITIAKTFQTFSPLQLKHLFSNHLIHYTKIVTDKELMYKISYVRKGKEEPDRLLWQLVKDKYVIFAITLNI